MKLFNRRKRNETAAAENYHVSVKVSYDLPQSGAMARQVAPDNPGDGIYSTVLQRSRPSAGIHVDEFKALNYSAVFACIRIISETIGTLPWHVYRRNGASREQANDNPVDWLLSMQPNSEMTASVFRETLQAHVLGWGNGYAEIERARNGTPIALWPLAPNECEPKRDSRYNIYYEARDRNGNLVELPSIDVFHLRGLSFDGLVGYSPIRLMRESISMGLALERFGSTFFGNGTRLSGTLDHPGKLTEEAAKRLNESFQSTYSGAGNAHKVAILEEGMKFSKMSVAPDEAQFLESRQFQITEIARWFRVPPHKLAQLDKAHFNNIEHQSREFVDDTVVPWVKRWEEEARIKLFNAKDRTNHYTHFNLAALLRGDTKSRYEAYDVMMRNGVFSINDVLALEDMNPVENGNIRLVQRNMWTLNEAMRGKNPNSDSQLSNEE